MLLSQFFPPSPSPVLCPQVSSLAVLFLKSLFPLIFDYREGRDHQKLCYRALCAQTANTMKMAYINGKQKLACFLLFQAIHYSNQS